MLHIIYKPKGRALEYAPLACNLYMGCTHGCKYCYAPGCVRRSLKDWKSLVVVRKDVVNLFEKDCKWLASHMPDDENRRVLFCFLSDPYQPLEGRMHITRKCLKSAKKHGIKVDILTKGSYERVAKDLLLMKEAGVRLGVTLSFVDDSKRKEWELGAAPVADRLQLLKTAHDMGISTWVSVEPVIDPDEALGVIESAHAFVNRWKIGKLNYNKTIEQKVDWHKFYWDIRAIKKKYGLDMYIKKSLRSYSRLMCK